MLKRILIAYSSTPPLIRFLRPAFERAGIDTECVLAEQNTHFDRLVIHPINKWAHNLRVIPKSKNLFELHPLAHKNYRSTLLQQAIRNFDPDLVLLIRGLGFRDWALKEAKTKFAWWTEKEERVDEALRELHEFDWYFFMSSSCVDTARLAGHANIGYLSHAVDSDFFRPIPGINKELDFCFVGRWSEKRQTYMEAALDITDNAAIYGGNWVKKNWCRPRFRKVIKGKFIDDEPLVELYNKSKIIINVSNWGLGEGKNRTGMNMRVFEAPATGSFLLTDESREMNSVVTPGEHVGTFTGLDEFCSKLKYYLSHDSERERIARQGMEQVRTSNSYDHLVSIIIDTYDEVCRAACFPIAGNPVVDARGACPPDSLEF